MYRIPLTCLLALLGTAASGQDGLNMRAVDSAGLPASIAAAERGASVLLVEQSSTLGGTMPLARM